MKSAILTVAALTTILATLAGCGSRRYTDTPRTASEQFLVSAAVDEAVAQLDFTYLRDRRVFLDDGLVDRVDRLFVISAVRARARREGVILVPNVENAHYIMELASGSVGIDRNDFILGIPASSVPTPFGVTPTPEAAIYKSVTQTGGCRVSINVYRRDDGRFFYNSGPMFGRSSHQSWWLFGAGPGTRQDVIPPEFPHVPEQREDPDLADEPAENPE